MTPVGTTVNTSLYFRQSTLEKESKTLDDLQLFPNFWERSIILKLQTVFIEFQITSRQSQKNYSKFSCKLAVLKKNPMDNVLLFSIKSGVILWRKRNTDCQQSVLSLLQKTGAICQNWGWFGLSNGAFYGSSAVKGHPSVP